MRKARIGITCGWEPGQVVEGWALTYAGKSLVERVEAAGAVPVLIPVLDQPELAAEYMPFLDGLVLSGEVLSIKRNVIVEHERNILRNSNPPRYDTEAAMIRAGLQAGKPMLGICRGFQVLVVEEGGSVLDGDVNENNYVLHQQGPGIPPSKTVHVINVQPGSTFHTLLGGVESTMVNSFHRQAVVNIPPGYVASARAPDDVVEVIEADDGRLVIGLQFHPEAINTPLWTQFFARFVTKVTEHIKEERRQ